MSHPIRRLFLEGEIELADLQAEEQAQHHVTEFQRSVAKHTGRQVRDLPTYSGESLNIPKSVVRS